MLSPRAEADIGMGPSVCLRIVVVVAFYSLFRFSVDVIVSPQ